MSDFLPAPWSDSLSNNRKLFMKQDICRNLIFLNWTPQEAWKCASKLFSTWQIQKVQKIFIEFPHPLKHLHWNRKQTKNLLDAKIHC